MYINVTTRVLEYNAVFSGCSVVALNVRILSKYGTLTKLPDLFFCVRCDELQALNRLMRYAASNN